jgi:hypothetical protein
MRQPYLTYRPARLHRLAEFIPWNRFLGSLKTFTNTGSEMPFRQVELLGTENDWRALVAKLEDIK